MKLIELNNTLPSQSVAFENGSNRWDITLRAISDICMICDVSFNGELILSGSRVVNGTPLIPYQYLDQYGNFAILCDSDDEVPYYERFGITQHFVFLQR